MTILPITRGYRVHCSGLLVNETEDKKIKESIQRINDNLNVKTGKFNKDDLLIQEIIKNHVIIQRGSLFYEKLGFFK